MMPDYVSNSWTSGLLLRPPKSRDTCIPPFFVSLIYGRNKSYNDSRKQTRVNGGTCL